MCVYAECLQKKLIQFEIVKRTFFILTTIFAFLTVNAQSHEESVWYIVDNDKKFNEVTSHEGVYSLFTFVVASKLIVKNNGEFSLYKASDYFGGTYFYDYSKYEGHLTLKEDNCFFKITEIGNFKKMIIKWKKNENLILVGKDNIPVYDASKNETSLIANKTPLSAEDEKRKKSDELTKQGDKFMEEKKYDFASKAYNMAYTEDPNNCCALYKESVAYIFWGGNYDRAISNLAKVLECNSTSEGHKLDAGTCYYYIGYAYSKKADRVKTKEFMQKAAEAGNKKAQDLLRK